MRPPVVLWSLDRVSFRTIVLEASTKKARAMKIVKILSSS
jgi:hypothetical protein